MLRLLLYADERSAAPLQVIELDAVHHRTFFFWHVFVEAAPAGLWYSWRVRGPIDDGRAGCASTRDASCSIRAPAASATPAGIAAARASGDTSASLRACVIDHDDYDWEGDRPLNRRPEDSVIYEMHVGGFTRHPSSRVGAARHVQRGDREDSLPAKPRHHRHRADARHGVRHAGRAGRRRRRSDTAITGATAPTRSSRRIRITARRPTARREFRDMVKALHRAGIGVILDVVFNHTAEGGADGPTISFKGLGNEIFYHLDPQDRAPLSRLHRLRQHRQLQSSAGRALSARVPGVLGREMHVDGFRFDLASVLARGEDGQPHVPRARALEHRVLRNARAHAPHRRGLGRGRAVSGRGFPGLSAGPSGTGVIAMPCAASCAAMPGLRGEVATRIAGSSDLYARSGRLPINSINFVTCHDGFTLADLVSYDEQAQRSQRRGQPRRHGREPQLELRRRGRHGRSGRAALCASAWRAIIWPCCCSPRACRCCWPGMKCCARSAATTMPSARTTKSPGSTGRSLRAQCGIPALHARTDRAAPASPLAAPTSLSDRRTGQRRGRACRHPLVRSRWPGRRTGAMPHSRWLCLHARRSRAG